MPENKNAYTRYLILDECLRNNYAHYSLTTLLAKLNEELELKDLSSIGRTQFNQDLYYMEVDLGAPITKVRNGKSKRITYEDPSFSIKQQHLSSELVQSIRDSLALLLQFKGLGEWQELKELIPRLDKEFGLDTVTENIIAFEENEYLTGLNYLNPLIQYIKNKTQLLVTYQSFNSSMPQQYDISPYFLKRHNQRWFLIGQLNDYKTLTNLALDRMETIALSQGTFIPNTEYVWSEYFDDMIGVSRPPDASLTTITIKFSPDQAPYIKTKPIHGSQRPIHEDETGYTISIEVIPNYELESLILSYGGKCKVISPVSFAEQVQERAVKKV